MATTFSNKCKVLSEIYIDQSYIDRVPPALDEFIETEGYTLALAYIIDRGYADINNQTTRIINETFDTLLETLNLKDTGFKTSTEIY